MSPCITLISPDIRHDFVQLRQGHGHSGRADSGNPLPGLILRQCLYGISLRITEIRPHAAVEMDIHQPGDSIQGIIPCHIISCCSLPRQGHILDNAILKADAATDKLMLLRIDKHIIYFHPGTSRPPAKIP